MTADPRQSFCDLRLACATRVHRLTAAKPSPLTVPAPLLQGLLGGRRGQRVLGGRPGGVPHRQPRERQRRREGDAGTRVERAHDRCRGVARAVEALDRGAVLAQDAAVLVRDKTALGTEVTRIERDGVIGRVVERSQAWVGLDPGVTVVDVIGVLAAVEVLVTSRRGEAVEAFDGAPSARRRGRRSAWRGSRACRHA